MDRGARGATRPGGAARQRRGRRRQAQTDGRTDTDTDTDGRTRSEQPARLAAKSKRQGDDPRVLQAKSKGHVNFAWVPAVRQFSGIVHSFTRRQSKDTRKRGRRARVRDGAYSRARPRVRAWTLALAPSREGALWGLLSSTRHNGARLGESRRCASWPGATLRCPTSQSSGARRAASARSCAPPAIPPVARRPRGAPSRCRRPRRTTARARTCASNAPSSPERTFAAPPRWEFSVRLRAQVPLHQFAYFCTRYELTAEAWGAWRASCHARGVDVDHAAERWWRAVRAELKLKPIKVNRKTRG
jgi:hypothetical protein